MSPRRPRVPGPSPQRLGRIRSRLLAWYDEHGQPFPWRDARDPYWALVAGVCSQQTQMPRVLPLWQRWIDAFPTLQACAAATPAGALRVWGDAGYPRRALHLQRAATVCVEDHDGALPRDEHALLALPGVGPFTAAIVRSFGFGDDAPALDTNVARVLGRLVHGDLQPAAETPPAALAATAARLLRPGTAVRWNPALMDYGAFVCKPRPRCAECVVASLCAARPRFVEGERARPLRRQPSFDGSDRQWRGRILARLRAADLPLRTALLARELATTADDRATVRRLLADLCAEGFAWQAGGSCGLGSAPETAPGSATLARPQGG